MIVTEYTFLRNDSYKKKAAVYFVRSYATLVSVYKTRGNTRRPEIRSQKAFNENKNFERKVQKVPQGTKYHLNGENHNFCE